MIENIKEFTARRLREIRAGKKLTLKEVANNVGIDVNTLSRYENGNYSMQLDVIEKLLNYYDVSYSIFFNIDYAKNHNKL